MDPRPRLFRFDQFEADSSRNKLTRLGSRIKIQDQPFRVLVLLLESPGELVTRETLRQALDSFHYSFKATDDQNAVDKEADNAVLELIGKHSASHWMISGHTDNQGIDARNQPLSEQRAASVITWLTAHGTDAAHLVPQGFGASRPVADNATSAGRTLNRRVEVSLSE